MKSTKKTAGATFIHMRRARRARLLSFPRRSVTAIKLSFTLVSKLQLRETGSWSFPH